MKKEDLEKILSQKVEPLKNSNILKNCIDIVRQDPSYKTETFSAHTKVGGTYHSPDAKITIDYRDGLTEFGGGHLKVYFEHELVLCCDRYSLKDSPVVLPQIDDFEIQDYHPGKWEGIIQRIKSGEYSKPKPQLKPEPLKLSDMIVKSVLERFS